MRLIQQPVLQWVAPLKNMPVSQGAMYIGLPGQDPKIPENRVTVFRKNQLNEYVEVRQPISLSDSGVPIYLGQEMALYVEQDCSIRVDDRYGAEQYLLQQYFGAQDDTLRVDLADGTADVGGVPASRLAKTVIQVSHLKALATTDLLNGQQYNVAGFYAGSNGTGGMFTFDASRNAADHNGVSVISVGALTAWDGTKESLTTYLNWTGSGTGCFVRQHKKKSINVLLCGAVADGIFDDTPAFQAAYGAGFDVFAPRIGNKYYRVGGLVVPEGAEFFGESAYRYTAFNVSDVEGLGYIVYNTDKPTFIQWGGSNRIHHLGFHGVNRSRPFAEDGSNGGLHVSDSYIFRLENGFGRSAGSGLGNNRLFRCTLSGNTNGISGMIDSHVYMCEINANEINGIRIPTGANDTTYIGNKIEWNNGRGVLVESSTSNTITGGVIDRNGLAGLMIGGSQIGLQVSNVRFRRNGRNAVENSKDDCHIEVVGNLESNHLVVLTNITTATGLGDGGEGRLSPSNAIIARDSAARLTINGGDLSGCINDSFRTISGGTLNLTSLSGVKVKQETWASSIVIESAAANNGYKHNGENIEDIVASAETGTSYVAVFKKDLIRVNTFQNRLYKYTIKARNPSSGARMLSGYIIINRSGADAVTIVTVSDRIGNGVWESLTPTVTTNADGTQLAVSFDASEDLQARVSLSREVM